MSSASASVSSPIASHVDVVVQLPDNTSGAFRVRQITPWDYSADNGRVGEAFGRMFNRCVIGGEFAEFTSPVYGDALICLVPTAEPLDDNARRFGVRGVRDLASMRRLALAFMEINLFDPEFAKEMGKFMTSLLAMMRRKVAERGLTDASSSSPTNSSGSATPPSSPTESPSSD